jgi:WD40 repeat protein
MLARAACAAAALALGGCQAGVHAASDGGPGSGSGGRAGDAGGTLDGGAGVPAINLDACGYFGLGDVHSAAISQDGTLLALGALDFVALVDVATQTLLQKLPAPNYLFSVKISPDGKYVAAGGMGFFYRIWRVADGAMIADVHPGGEPFLTFSPDGAQLLVSVNETVSAYAFPSLTPQWTASIGERAEYAPDGSFIAGGPGVLVDPATGTQIGTVGGQTPGTGGTAVAVSSTGLVAITAGIDGAIEVWRVADKTKVATIPNSTDIEELAFSPDGTRLAGSTLLGSAAFVWSVPDGAQVAHYAIGGGVYPDISFSSTGALLTTTSQPVVRLIDITDPAPDGKDIWRYSWGHTSLVEVVDVSPDGKLVATATRTDPDVDVWDLATSELVTTLSHAGNPQDLVFSRDSQRLYVAAGTDVVEWRVSDWSKLRTTTAEPRAVTGIALSADGSLLATGETYESVKIWRTSDMTNTLTIPVSDYGGSPQAFSPDGTLLGTIGTGDHPAILRLSDGTQVCQGTGSGTSFVGRIGFTPDGSKLLAIGSTGLDELSISDCSLVRELPNGGDLYSFAVSPSGKEVVTSDTSHGVGLWELSTGALTGTGMFNGTLLRSLVLTFVPGDPKRLVTTNLAAARMYCRAADDGWIVG